MKLFCAAGLAAISAGLAAQERYTPEHANPEWTALGETPRAWFDYDPRWLGTHIVEGYRVLPVIAVQSRPKPEDEGGPREAMGPLSFYWRFAVDCDRASLGILAVAARTQTGELHMVEQVTEPVFRSYPPGGDGVEARLIGELCRSVDEAQP